MSVVVYSRKIQIHPVVLLVSWIGLLLVLQHMVPELLQATAILLLMLAMIICRSQLLNLLRKSRWLFYSMILLYMLPEVWQLAGHGTDMEQEAWKGVSAGFKQCMHLLAVLSSLSLFIGRLSRSELIDGIYRLIYPLILIRVDVRKLAIRLMLTLQQAELMTSTVHKKDKKSLAGWLNFPSFESREIEIEERSLGLIDWLLSISIIMFVLYILI